MKSIKCRLCGERVTRLSYGKHLIKKHSSTVDESGMDAEHLAFFLRTGKEKGVCIMKKYVPSCHVDTGFNPKTNKLHRLCGHPACAQAYREQFKKRMKKTHGKVHLLNEPAQQQKMLASRKISGTYKFQDGKEFPYTGSYEKDMLEFLDLELNWPSADIVDAGDEFVFQYELDGDIHYYIPDKIIPSLGPLILEIKSKENKHYRLREKESGMEDAKREAVQKTGYPYLMVADKNYGEFMQYLEEYRKNLR